MAITKISPSVVDFDDGITITVDDNSDVLTLKSTDADENSGPRLALTRDSGSPADNDYIGLISFNADDDGGNVTRFGYMVGQIADASNSSEDGVLQIHSMVGGTERNRINITSTETVLNEDSVDLDFRVESDNSANALFVQGSDGFVGIGRTPANILDIEFADGSNVTAGNIGDNSVTGINMINTTNSNGAGTHIKMMANNGNNMTAIAHEQVATNSAQLLFYTENAGTFAQKLRINEAGTMFSAAGLAFGGDTAAANQLDDYEEGTFTPVLIGSSSNPTTNGAQAQAKYVKVGSTVHVTARLYWSSISGGSGDLQVAGFPFTSGTLTGSWWPGTLGYTSSSHWDSGKQPYRFMLAAADTGGKLWLEDGSATVTTADHDDGAGELYIQITYHTF